MSTSILPRVPRTIIRPGGEHKYHTVHFDRYIFTVQKNGTSIVAFRKERDVIRFSKMIESHFDLTHEWPIVNFEDTLLYRNTKSNKLKYINIQEWNEDTLATWCIKNAFSMLDISSFEGDNKLIGKSIHWDVDDGYFYTDFLNEKLTI
jgi:hypothetical protein